jgi:hypothetical protein
LYGAGKVLIASIIQPALFPWLGYFDIIRKSDIFVFFDNVKFEKRNWQMRNRIKILTKDGESAMWINIPTKDITQQTLIKDALIDNTKDWKIKHLQMFRSHYGKGVNDIQFLLNMYERNWERICDFNVEFTSKCCEFLGINTKLVKASDLDVSGKRSQLLVNICKKVGATEYLSGPTGKVYLEDDRPIFEEAKIKIIYHDYKHPIYRQRGKTFIEKLSILDLIFNEKEDSSRYFT